MSKLKLVAAIVAAMLVVAVVAVIAFKAGQKSTSSTQPEVQAGITVEEGGETVKPFNYQAPLPVDGKLKGVVELGSTGFNSFIINMDKNKNWKLEKAEFGASGVLEGNSSEEDVLRKLKNYIKGIIDSGVKGSNIHFVVSSGAQKNEAVITIISALKKIGYVVNSVTPEKEGEYALKCVLPKQYETKSFVVDMGSGNTKISWMSKGKIDALETYGAKYYQESISVQAAYQAVSAVIKSVPKANREVCFIIGGVPFQMAKQDRVEKERYTALRSEQAYVSDKFADDKSQAGLNIYKAIREATGCKTFVFDWDANFSIGFLLSIPF